MKSGEVKKTSANSKGKSVAAKPKAVTKKPIAKKTVAKKPVAKKTNKKDEKKTYVPLHREKPKHLRYKHVGGKSWAQKFAESIPEEVIPSNLTGYILMGIFLIVILVALVQFPMDEMIKGRLDVNATAGIPYDFIVFELQDPDPNPFDFTALFLDLLIYLLVAYAIEIIWNIIKGLDIWKSRKEKSRRAKVFKTGTRKSMSERTTQAVFQGNKPNSKPKVKNVTKEPYTNRPILMQVPGAKKKKVAKKVAKKVPAKKPVAK